MVGQARAEVVRLALVGLGDIAVRAHLPALLRCAAVELSALVDVDGVARDTAGGVVAAAGARVPATADVDAVLADDAVAGVVLATPPWVTTDLAARALRAGKYVLAEKPLAASTAAAEPLRALPETVLARLQAGLTYRHDPALERLRRWIVDGPLTGPLLVRAHIYDEQLDPDDPAHESRMHTTLEHGPPAVHEGAHVFDWLAHLLGADPTVADAWAVRTDTRLAAPNLNGARLAYPGGTVALVEFGWLTAALPRCELSLLGPRAHAVLDGGSFRLTLDTGQGPTVVDFPGTRTQRCFDRQLARFVGLVRGRLTTAVPGWAEAMAALRLGERMAARARAEGTAR